MFLDELGRAIDQLGQNPEQYLRYDFGTRCGGFLSDRVPEASADVEIIAIAHARRRPGCWRERLRSSIGNFEKKRPESHH